VSPIVWWEIETPDPDAFIRFHGAMWGWAFTPAFQDSALGRDYWLIGLDGTGIGGLQRARSDERPRAGTRLYLEVPELEDALAKAVDLGAEIERGRTALGGDDRWFANLIDPAGISIGLWTAAAAR
jgi:predicted enzyme related to lactoylglutathione lyase